MHKETGALHCPQRPEPKRDEAERERAPLRQVYYRNGASARAAGVAPIRRGQPGYRPALDRDGDGWACEPYRGRR
ncbi:excalibur calcium-binding domain-containing protein [Qipengyuania sp. 1NDH17]|uniref:Excalibur calcium-binding domain-containing protein n=1 Tax=Qipengyuania polymorpha TaxID=2867234 RepID=A0ABS7J2M7_9SPHN|nr:excalibur calcium-binding domain-containing protein [Qipengyuania polymorpha]MBX7457718.1 excalibur calcium-binding domain-containing protein [Qipengyuania polymorpha]